MLSKPTVVPWILGSSLLLCHKWGKSIYAETGNLGAYIQPPQVEHTIHFLWRPANDLGCGRIDLLVSKFQFTGLLQRVCTLNLQSLTAEWKLLLFNEKTESSVSWGEDFFAFLEGVASGGQSTQAWVSVDFLLLQKSPQFSIETDSVIEGELGQNKKEGGTRKEKDRA